MPPPDPYVAFTRRFFARWSPLYDAFAAPIGFAYAAAARLSGAAPGRRLLDLCTGTGEIARRLAFADGEFDATVLSFALHDMPGAVRVAVLREAARVSREGVVVLDYEPPAREPWRRAVVALLGSFETPYLRGFVRQGGTAAALAAAGLAVTAVERPLVGFFAVRRAGRPPIP